VRRDRLRDCWSATHSHVRISVQMLVWCVVRRIAHARRCTSSCACRVASHATRVALARRCTQLARHSWFAVAADRPRSSSHSSHGSCEWLQQLPSPHVIATCASLIGPRATTRPRCGLPWTVECRTCESVELSRDTSVSSRAHHPPTHLSGRSHRCHAVGPHQTSEQRATGLRLTFFDLRCGRHRRHADRESTMSVTPETASKYQSICLPSRIALVVTFIAWSHGRHLPFCLRA
jgi:hypothetical protein